ncbi:MAG: ABC transporter permease [Candidatus Aminicenantes bacterium]|nr:ABC transporter permease [Candidatus Aminicenantes bacterium]
MVISEQGYVHWQGTFIERRFPWWPITRLGIRLAFKRKFFKFVFSISLLPAVMFSTGVYISERLDDFQFMLKGQDRLLEVNPAFFKSYFTSEPLLFLMVMIMVLAGAGLICDDLKYNSLQLYFSRPLRKRDYVLGKMATVFFFLLILTLVPGLLFVLLKLIFAGSFKFLANYPWIPVSVIAFSLLVTLFFAFYTLLVSSLSKNRRYVSILLFLVYIFSNVFFGIFYSIFHNPYFCLLSIQCDIQQVGAAFFRQSPHYDVPWIYSFLVLAAICCLSAFVLKRKIRGVEVVK